MTVRQYWDGSTVVVEWTMTGPDGTPITGATVTGQIAKPDGTTATMTVTADGHVYTATYVAGAPGRHAWRMESAGAAVDAREGDLVVRRSLVGLPPINNDRTTPVGQLRLLITDVDETDPLFSDDDLEAMLAIEGGSVKLAAAQALETIATSEALVSKKIRTQDLATDGPAVAKELRERAAALRKQATEAPLADDSAGIYITDFDPSRWC